MVNRSWKEESPFTTTFLAFSFVLQIVIQLESKNAHRNQSLQLYTHQAAHYRLGNTLNILE